MPRFQTVKETNVVKAKAWIKENHPGFDVVYHLMKAAMLADGIGIRGELSADQLPELTTEQAAALAAGKAAIGVK